MEMLATLRGKARPSTEPLVSPMTGPSHGSDGMWLLPSLRRIQEWKAAACDGSPSSPPNPGSGMESSFAQCLWPMHLLEICHLVCKRMSNIFPQSIDQTHLWRLQDHVPPWVLNPRHTASVHACSLPPTSGPWHVLFALPGAFLHTHIVVYHCLPLFIVHPGSLQAGSVSALGSQRTLDISPAPSCDSSIQTYRFPRASPSLSVHWQTHGVWFCALLILDNCQCSLSEYLPGSLRQLLCLYEPQFPWRNDL